MLWKGRRQTENFEDRRGIDDFLKTMDAMLGRHPDTILNGMMESVARIERSREQMAEKDPKSRMGWRSRFRGQMTPVDDFLSGKLSEQRALQEALEKRAILYQMQSKNNPDAIPEGQ